MGIHTGTPHMTAEGYVGPDVHRAARIAGAGHVYPALNNIRRSLDWLISIGDREPDLDERRRLLDECERLLRELANEAGLGWVTYLRGMTFIEERNPDRAREALKAAADIFRRGGRR